MDFTLKNKGHRLVEKGFECEKRINRIEIVLYRRGSFFREKKNVRIYNKGS